MMHVCVAYICFTISDCHSTAGSNPITLTVEF
jgi:hypothetical protein